MAHATKLHFFPLPPIEQAQKDSAAHNHLLQQLVAFKAKLKSTICTASQSPNLGPKYAPTAKVRGKRARLERLWL